MTTFSQLVDSIVAETLRPNMRKEVASYLNQTIRECHFEPSRGNVAFLNANYREAQVIADSEIGAFWAVPNVATFQGLAAVRFDSVFRDGAVVYADEVMPGRRAELVTHGYQRAGDRVFFKGYGGVNAAISLAWFEYPAALKYYEVANRPAQWDAESGWSYHASFDSTDESRSIARSLVSNWLLLRWYMVVEEGLRAKVYKRLSDDARQRVSYSLYMQQRQGLITSEIADIGGVYHSG
jgi:hypothetical protein